MRSRTVITRSGRHFRGKFPSKKLGCTVHWESLIERDAILLFEYHPLVLRYQEQPIKELYYNHRGEQRTCYPDFLLHFVGGAELLVEVKSHSHLARASVRATLDDIAVHFERQSRAYRVLTELDVRRQPLHGNLRHLHEAQQASCASEDAQSMADGLDSSARYPLSDLIAMLGGKAAVLNLVATGVLRMDLEQPIAPNSKIWKATNTEAGHGAFHI